jgi:hypothetical protein
MADQGGRNEETKRAVTAYLNHESRVNVTGLRAALDAAAASAAAADRMEVPGTAIWRHAEALAERDGRWGGRQVPTFFQMAFVDRERYLSQARRDLEAILPDLEAALLEQIEDSRCESCEGSGIYEEGDEWAPCSECDLGREFLACLRSHAAEVREQMRERLRGPEAVSAVRVAAREVCEREGWSIDTGIRNGIAFAGIRGAFHQIERGEAGVVKLRNLGALLDREGADND